MPLSWPSGFCESLPAEETAVGTQSEEDRGRFGGCLSLRVGGHETRPPIVVEVVVLGLIDGKELVVRVLNGRPAKVGQQLTASPSGGHQTEDVEGGAPQRQHRTVPTESCHPLQHRLRPVEDKCEARFAGAEVAQRPQGGLHAQHRRLVRLHRRLMFSTSSSSSSSAPVLSSSSMCSASRRTCSGTICCSLTTAQPSSLPVEVWRQVGGGGDVLHIGVTALLRSPPKGAVLAALVHAEALIQRVLHQSHVPPVEDGQTDGVGGEAGEEGDANVAQVEDGRPVGDDLLQAELVAVTGLVENVQRQAAHRRTGVVQLAHQRVNRPAGKVSRPGSEEHPQKAGGVDARRVRRGGEHLGEERPAHGVRLAVVQTGDDELDVEVAGAAGQADQVQQVLVDVRPVEPGTAHRRMCEPPHQQKVVVGNGGGEAGGQQRLVAGRRLRGDVLEAAVQVEQQLLNVLRRPGLVRLQEKHAGALDQTDHTVVDALHRGGGNLAHRQRGHLCRRLWPLAEEQLLLQVEAGRPGASLLQLTDLTEVVDGGQCPVSAALAVRNGRGHQTGQRLTAMGLAQQDGRQIDRRRLGRVENDADQCLQQAKLHQALQEEGGVVGDVVEAAAAARGQNVLRLAGHKVLVQLPLLGVVAAQLRICRRRRRGGRSGPRSGGGGVCTCSSRSSGNTTTFKARK
ncbi:hypothetical protein TYRP_010092 [Tyrophagus putrescentiae]|nr:hypothetical protein TYRP_010092 [Tyrophagus putrescentiae]